MTNLRPIEGSDGEYTTEETADTLETTAVLERLAEHARRGELCSLVLGVTYDDGSYEVATVFADALAALGLCSAVRERIADQMSVAEFEPV